MINEFTIGVEEEYMVIDPVTRELASHDQKIVEAAEKIYKDQVKAEMHQAVVEVGTGICKDTTQARLEISGLRHTVSQLAGELGLRIGAAGTHPFSRWEKQLITEHPRYNEIINEFYRDKTFLKNYIPYLSDVEKMGIHKAPIMEFANTSHAAQSYRDLWTEIKEGVL